MNKLITNYLKNNNYHKLDIRAVLFDMDGVIYNSMPAHELSWQKAMREWGIKATRNEFYLQEGRPAKLTINLLFQRNLNRDATEQEIEEIYKRKTTLFFENDNGAPIEGVKEVIEIVKNRGLLPILVTGSGQPNLYKRLNGDFPDVFTPETMVTASDVKIGKPNPEAYLMGLEKAGNLQPNQAIVLENAPLGVESAHKAKIFTVAINTGPLSNKVLNDAGADLLMETMEELNKKLPELLDMSKTLTL